RQLRADDHMHCVLTVTCKSIREIVAAISNYLAEQGCKIFDSSQFDDLDTGKFFMRVSFISEEGVGGPALAEGFKPIAEKFAMDAEIHDAKKRMKVLLMVSRFGHCLKDLLYRWKTAALPIDIVGGVSNYFDYQKVVVNHDIPFHNIKVTKDNKPQAEAQLLDIDQTGTKLVVLARYMQVLSNALCRKMSGRIINILHSFLPSFKGANPYKQAYERGVKLIGGTALYVISTRSDHRAGHGAHHACAICRGLCVNWARCGEPGAGARHPCVYPSPLFHQRQPHRRLPGKPGKLCIGADGRSKTDIIDGKQVAATVNDAKSPCS
ncbi:formyltetrahydrofolate deformylase, partial [Mesorhizobium shonense]